MFKGRMALGVDGIQLAVCGSRLRERMGLMGRVGLMFRSPLAGLAANGELVKLFLKEGQILAVTLRLKFLDGYETQGGRIHAVAHPGGLRSVVEDVSQVRATLGTDHFIADHSMGGIMSSDYRLLIDGFSKTGPTCAGVELVF